MGVGDFRVLRWSGDSPGQSRDKNFLNKIWLHPEIAGRGRDSSFARFHPRILIRKLSGRQETRFEIGPFATLGQGTNAGKDSADSPTRMPPMDKAMDKR
jgi:hypothetical protein